MTTIDAVRIVFMGGCLVVGCVISWKMYKLCRQMESDNEARRRELEERKRWMETKSRGK